MVSKLEFSFSLIDEMNVCRDYDLCDVSFPMLLEHMFFFQIYFTCIVVLPFLINTKKKS